MNVRQLAVVHVDGDLHLHFAGGHHQERAELVGQPELVGGPLEVQIDGFEGTHGERMQESGFRGQGIGENRDDWQSLR